MTYDVLFLLSVWSVCVFLTLRATLFEGQLLLRLALQCDFNRVLLGDILVILQILAISE